MSDVRLIKYDAACRAVAKAKSVDEISKIRNVHEAIRVAARLAKNKALEIDAAEIRLRSERRLGELIGEQKRTVGLNAGTAGTGRPQKGGSKRALPKDERPTLAQAGIDKKLSARAQKLAQVPEERFEGMLGAPNDGYLTLSTYPPRSVIAKAIREFTSGITGAA